MGYLCIPEKMSNYFSALGPNVFFRGIQTKNVWFCSFFESEVGWLSLVVRPHIIHFKKEKNILWAFVLRRTSKLNTLNLSNLINFILIESHIFYSICLWGDFKSHMDKVFILKEKAIKSIYGLPPRDHFGDSFVKWSILTVPCLYVFELAMYINNQNKNPWPENP